MKFWVIHPPAFCNPNQAPSSAASDSRWPHLFLKQRRHPFQKHHPKRCWIPSTGHRDKGKTIPEANVKQALQIKNLWNACVRYVWGWTRSYKKWNRAPRIFELTMTLHPSSPPQTPNKHSARKLENNLCNHFPVFNICFCLFPFAKGSFQYQWSNHSNS